MDFSKRANIAGFCWLHFRAFQSDVGGGARRIIVSVIQSKLRQLKNFEIGGAFFFFFQG